MARVPDLYRFCRLHRLELITIADLAKYRLDKAPEICVKAPNGDFDRQAEQTTR
jgi:hypothetical protein